MLATNFSFAAFYENLTLSFGSRFEALRLIPERFRAWRQARRERKQQRLELRRQAKDAGASFIMMLWELKSEATPPPSAAALTEMNRRRLRKLYRRKHHRTEDHVGSRGGRDGSRRSAERVSRGKSTEACRVRNGRRNGTRGRRQAKERSTGH